MVLHKSRWATVCTLVAVALLGSMVPTDVLAGKPGGGTADPPPVMYEIQFFDGLTNLADLNNSGMAVGYYNLDGEDRGSLYDPSVPSHAIDLNFIVSGIPEGWVIASAVGINDLGDIVGKLRQSGAARNTSRGFVIDMLVTDANGDPVTDQNGDPVPPQLYEIPDAQFESPRTYGSRINDNGDILGKYFVNDGTVMRAYLFNPGFDGQQILWPTDLRDFNSDIDFAFTGIALNNPDPITGRDLQITGSLPSSSGGGVAFRYTLGGALEVFDPFVDSSGNTIMLTHVGGISQSGTVFGSADVVFPKKKRGQTSTRALFRYGTSAEMFEWEYNEGATGFNDVGDFVAGSERLYVEGVGFLNIFDLIDTSDPDAESFLQQSSLRLTYLTNPTDTGFPMIVGGAWLGTSQTTFLLTPVAVPQ